MLHVLGLGGDAGTLYQAMIRYPSVGIVEFGLSFGWPEERMRSALGELERLSLIRRTPERMNELALIDPEIALQDLISERERELFQHQQDIADMRATAASIVAEYDKADKAPNQLPFQQFLDHKAARHSADKLARSCTSEIISFVLNDSEAQENLLSGELLDQALTERGIRLRLIHLESITNDADAMAHARWLMKQGGEIRTIPSLPVCMTIYDRTVGLIAVDRDRSDAGVSLLKGQGVLSTLCAFFDHLWERATELGTLPHRDREGLTGQEREILRLLSEGNTDQAVARKLGISVRTTRRVLSKLSERLGARSRFQIAVRAAEAGWLDPYL